jgi:hypothetical protein
VAATWRFTIPWVDEGDTPLGTAPFSMARPPVLSSEDTLTSIRPDTRTNSKTFSRRISQTGPAVPPATSSPTTVFLSRESTPERSHGNKTLIGGHGLHHRIFTDHEEQAPFARDTLYK